MTATTKLGLLALTARPETIAAHAIAGLPEYGTRVAEFDVWRQGYAGAAVQVLKAGTTTLADLYSDPGLTIAVSNPQILATLNQDGVTYGKFTTPIYVAEAYSLLIDDTDQTGVQRLGLVSVAGEDVSGAVVRSTRGSYDRTLADWLDDDINASGYGALGTSATVNTATLTAAIAAASGQSGGVVLVPRGNFIITSLTLPAGVVLRGRGRGVTTLRSTEADAVVTLEGDRAGLSNLTLDGVNSVAGSIGVYAVGIDGSVLDGVTIKRFNTGIEFRGGRRQAWFSLDLDSNIIGAELRGDADVSADSLGDQFRELVWIGGKVSSSTSYGVRLVFEDQLVADNQIMGVEFSGNVVGLQVLGARQTGLSACRFDTNTSHLVVGDDTDITMVASNTVDGLRFDGGSFLTGGIVVSGTAQNIVLTGTDLNDVDWVMTNPSYPVSLVDCREDTSCTYSGTAGRLFRSGSNRRGVTSDLVTTNNTATVLWETTLGHGEYLRVEAKVIARRKNGRARSSWDLAVGAFRPGATLAYDGQTANFTVGTVLIGTTSSAYATIIADSDSGATGTLTLRDVNGTFQDNEEITDDTGVAFVNGTLTGSSAQVWGSSVTNLTTAQIGSGTIGYGTQTANYGVGKTLTGATSGATAYIEADTDTGSSGTLTLSNISGVFSSAELMTDNSSTPGSATSSGLLTADYACTFNTSGGNLRLVVTGASSHTVNWLADLSVTRTN